MKTLAIGLLLAGLLVMMATAVSRAHDDDDSAMAAPFALALGDDGVATLPVFYGPFPETKNMVFLSQMDPDQLGAKAIPGALAKAIVNDIWGWTSPAGEEYALVPNTGGIAVVRVSNPSHPVYLGKIESQLPGNFGNIWGDGGTFGHYAYFVTEVVDSRIAIADLSGLDALGPAAGPDAPLAAPTWFVQAGGYRSAHNIYINEASGFAYLAGVRLAAGAANNACGLDVPPRFNTLILDLNAAPENPSVAACVPDAGEHDFYVVNYTGPDTEHQGKEIAFVFDGRDREGAAMGNPVGGKTEIWDVTDKNNIAVLASWRTPGMVYSHNGWTTEEQDYLFVGDEIDELVLAGWAFAWFFTQPVAAPTNMPETGTYIIDIGDLDNPVVADRYTDGTVGLDHNFIVEGDKLYIASYTSGTRVLQINRANGGLGLAPYAVMDTEPRLQKNILNINQEHMFGSAFLGQWGIYPFPGSETIIASDINNGLIVMRLSDGPCQGITCSR